MIARVTWDGQLIQAPEGTRKCAQMVARPHPSDLVHGLFAADNPGPTLQLMTQCGKRAHYFVPESEDREIDCPDCLGSQRP